MGLKLINNELFQKLMLKFAGKTGVTILEGVTEITNSSSSKSIIIPPSRVRYLSDITDAVRQYNKEIDEQADIAS